MSATRLDTGDRITIGTGLWPNTRTVHLMELDERASGRRWVLYASGSFGALFWSDRDGWFYVDDQTSVATIYTREQALARLRELEALLVLRR
jgi:hypothetical protein